jgi:hypothetical protein
MPWPRSTQRWRFPDPRQADADGLGADLHPAPDGPDPAQGLSSPGQAAQTGPLCRHSPEPRLVLVPADLHISLVCTRP